MGCHSHRARRHRRTDHAPRPPLALFTSAAKPDESTDATATVDTGRDPDRRPARQGEHSEEVLRELGYSDDEICHFTNGGVLLHTRDTK
jgi:crotonobetainyl-CoA:carnitine CoA-transferase CaiB-like acyl-CoA transferase